MTAAAISVHNSWTALEQLTASMHRAAAGEDWAQVLELSIHRHQSLLEHFGRFPVGPDNAEFYQTHLTTLLSGEQELQRIALEARKRVMRDGVASQRTGRAIGAYLAR